MLFKIKCGNLYNEIQLGSQNLIVLFKNFKNKKKHRHTHTHTNLTSFKLREGKLNRHSKRNSP